MGLTLTLAWDFIEGCNYFHHYHYYCSHHPSSTKFTEQQLFVHLFDFHTGFNGKDDVTHIDSTNKHKVISQ